MRTFFCIVNDKKVVKVYGSNFSDLLTYNRSSWYRSLTLELTTSKNLTFTPKLECRKTQYPGNLSNFAERKTREVEVFAIASTY